VGNDRNEHGALYCEVFGGLARGQMVSAGLIAMGFCMLWDNTTLGTRRPRVFGENELDLHTVGHEVSLTAGEKGTSGNRLTLIMWPRWHSFRVDAERLRRRWKLDVKLS
jgi:hypothetical protein